MPPFLLLAVAAPQEPPREPAWGSLWATLTIAPARDRTRTTIAFGTRGDDAASRRRLHWVRRTFEDAAGRRLVSWTSSRTCPAVDRAVAALRDLPPATPRIPRYDDDVVVMVDGIDTAYTLETESRYGIANGSKLVVATNTGTPLAAWADRVEAEITPCLSGRIPE